MTIGHVAATALEQTTVSTCKELDFVKPYICNGIGKIAHEGIEAAIDYVAMPLAMKMVANPINFKEIGKSIVGSIAGSYAVEILAPIMHTHEHDHEHEFDWFKVGVTTTVGIGTALALPATLGALTGAAIIAGTTAATGHIYDYMTCE